MHVEVTKFRRNGTKLTDAERKAPQVGFIRIHYWHLRNDTEDTLLHSSVVVLLPYISKKSWREHEC